MTIFEPSNSAILDNVTVYRYPGFLFAETGLTSAQLLSPAAHTLTGFTYPTGAAFVIPNQVDTSKKITKVEFRARGAAFINNTVIPGATIVDSKILGWGNVATPSSRFMTFDGSAIAQGLFEDDVIYTDAKVSRINMPYMEAFYGMSPGNMFQANTCLPAAAGHAVLLYMTVTVLILNREQAFPNV